MINIRKATTADAPRLLEIYAPYVENTAISFEYDVPSLQEFSHRISQISRHYPYIVAEQDGRVIGYAYASRFKERAAFQWSVETSIYFDPEMHRHGIGKLLYCALEQQLRARGITNMNACITYTDHPDSHLPTGSVPFHEAIGFTPCAHFHNCGYKFHNWYDIIWMEKMINGHDSDLR